MRMFPDGPRHLIDGWTKGFTSGAGLTPLPALLLSSLWLSGMMAVVVCLLLLPLGNGYTVAVVLAAHLAVAGRLATLSRAIGSFSFWNALLFPVGLLFYQWVFGRALVHRFRGVPTQWKGRDVSHPA